jgi:cell wall-associated NlpC family hydrolase
MFGDATRTLEGGHMRRLLFVICAVFAAASVVSLSTVSAKAQSGEQYEASDGAEATQEPQETTATHETTAPDESTPDESASGVSPSEGDFVSQGSTVDPDAPAAVAAQKDLAVEEGLPEYSQVVDNTTKGAFRAPGWKAQRGPQSHKGSYVSSSSDAKPARFEVEIPTTNDYSVYAWWPQARGNGLASTFTVETADGERSDKVDQRNEGGMWIKIGAFAMQKGQRYVEVAPGDDGLAVADAIMVVRGEMALPPDMELAGASMERSGTTDSKSISRFSGRDVVRQAKRHIGDRYRYATCTRSLKSCTCLTRMAVKPFGHKLPMTESGQWKYDRSRKVSKKRPGDEVFFKEGGGSRITHVGIYSGNGYLVHASTYFGKVVNSEMKYLKGYSGAKRFKSR